MLHASHTVYANSHYFCSSPEEALKEVKDPIIRSAIEPLSDKIAEMKKNAESLAKHHKAKEHEGKQD